MEDWKIKVVVFWLVLECAMLVAPVLEFYESGLIEDIIAGEVGGSPITPEVILLLAIVMMVPLVMVVVSFTLRDSINRWVNIIVGVVFVVLGLLSPIEYLAMQSVYFAHVTLIGIVEVAVAAMIVWYAWKSKQKT